MRENPFKAVLRSAFFPHGSTRTIQCGPLRGKKFRVSDVTGMSPWYSGTEREHQRLFKRLVRPDNVAMDIGANWGLHTLYLSQLVGPTGKVIAVEPFPLALVELAWHIQANSCRNVTVVPYALSDSDGEASFAVAGSSSEGSLTPIYQGTPFHKGQITVQTQTLDSLAKQLRIDRLDLVKIDVEGAESKVLSGARQTLKEFRPYFVIDLHTPQQDVSVAAILTQSGYKLSRLEGPPILRTDVGWPNQEGVWGTLLASPAEFTR